MNRRSPSQRAGWRGLPLTALLVAVVVVAQVVGAADAERIVVMNVRLAGRDVPTQDVPVNLLIIDGNLSVVDAEPAVPDPTALADAEL